jgi:hypothetical protein
LWTQDRLGAIALRNEHPGLLDVDVELETDGYVFADLGGDVSMVLALIPAQELLAALPGIDDLTVFDLNVRLGLGNTRINRELTATIRLEDEHALFPAYHNGLTLLTNQLDRVDDTNLRLHGVSVVNGCQSLLALQSSSDELTPKLSVIVKIVDLAPGAGLEARVTYRANNQNPVNMRDQRSTHAIQLHLQREVDEAGVEPPKTQMLRQLLTHDIRLRLRCRHPVSTGGCRRGAEPRTHPRRSRPDPVHHPAAAAGVG